MTLGEQLAYVAGIVDGEGSFNIGHNSPCAYQLSLKVSMTSQAAIRKVGGILPGSVNPEPDEYGFHRFAAQSKKAAQCCQMLLPYLAGKLRQAEIGLRFSKLPTLQGKRPRTYPEWLRSAKENLRLEIIKSHAPNLNSSPSLAKPKESYAYCAGLLDGEGAIMLVRSGAGWVLRVAVSMTDLAPVMRFAEVFGGKVKPSYRKTRRGKTVFVCILERRAACEACRRTLPYLKVKRAQAELGIRFDNNVVLWTKRDGGRYLGFAPVEVKAKRQRWIQEMRTLNRRADAETKSRRSAEVPQISDSPASSDGKAVGF